jgi:hypothetical protein
MLVRAAGVDQVLVDVRRPGAVLLQVLLVLSDVLTPPARGEGRAGVAGAGALPPSGPP